MVREKITFIVQTVAVLAALALCGCAHTTTARRNPPQASQTPSQEEQARVFELQTIFPQQAAVLLTEAGLGKVALVPGRNAVAVAGSASVQRKAGIVLELVDVNEPYAVEILAPVSMSRDIPGNDRIAEALGAIAIGTFSNPPQAGPRARGLIDVCGESVVAILPARLQRQAAQIVHAHPADLRPARNADVRHATIAPIGVEAREPIPGEPNGPAAITAAKAETPIRIPLSQPMPVPTEPNLVEDKPAAAVAAKEPARLVEAAVVPPGEPVSESNAVTVRSSRMAVQPARTVTEYKPAVIANGDDTLELDLPDKLDLIQLLDLATEYLKLDYLYDAEKIRGQSVSLRLHGKLQGKIQVRELYPLLESVLKFKGFAMTRHNGNLVTIVPLAEALQVDPTLLDAEGQSLETGDMVVTRAFDLQYVNTASAVNLLEAMKLSVAVSPIAETQTLIVTCYAHRMERIERLLNLVDRPGKPKEFRYRQLKYTMAATLAAKVEKLAAELQTVPVKIAPAMPCL